MDSTPNVPRIESLTVKNYRVLRHFELKDANPKNRILNPLSPLTVLLGPNGSGKSTLFDVFAFLSECFIEGLRRTWDRRGGFRELRSRGTTGPIEFTLQYRERPKDPRITYLLSVDEDHTGPFVAKESLMWKRGKYGRPFRFLHFEKGKGNVISGEHPELSDERTEEFLSSPDVLAVNSLGQFARHSRVTALRSFVMRWHLSNISTDNIGKVSESGYHEHLSQKGDNLANVIRYLQERDSDRLENIRKMLSERVPRLEEVQAKKTLDGRLVLFFKDEPFELPILAQNVSDGTLKTLAYLTLLHDPDPPNLIGIEELENQLHPRLLRILAEACRHASAKSQLIITTHSPDFVDGLRPEELWVLYRDEEGFSHARRASNMPRIRDFMAHGALLGNLWMEGHFDVGDPLTNAGGIKHGRAR